MSAPSQKTVLRPVIAIVVVLSLALTLVVGPAASAAPRLEQNPLHRATAVVRAAGFEPTSVPQLIETGEAIEEWILHIEVESDVALAKSETLEATLLNKELAVAGLRRQLDLAEAAVDGADLTRGVVEVRNSIPGLIRDWEQAAEDFAAVEDQLEQARVAHSQSLDALMIAWNLRQHVGTRLVDFAQGDEADGPQGAWAPLLTEWSLREFRRAKAAVADLEAAENPAVDLSRLNEGAATPDAATAETATPETATPESMVWPAIGAVNSGFGMRIHPVWGGYRMHTGIDIDGDTGDLAIAVAGGEVVRAGWNGGYGNTVEIDHGDGLTSLYAHLSSFEVSLGDEVEGGELIGLVGATGTATDAHVHFEIRENGTAVDPLAYLP